MKYHPLNHTLTATWLGGDTYAVICDKGLKWPDVSGAELLQLLQDYQTDWIGTTLKHTGYVCPEAKYLQEQATPTLSLEDLDL